MKRFGAGLFLVGAMLAGSWTADCAELTLAKDGKPSATIVIAVNATKSAQLAAYEMQWHVREISGATLPIVRDDARVIGTRILIGDSVATRALGIKAGKFKMQEYLVRSLPNALVCIGRDQDDRKAVDYDSTSEAAVKTWPSFYDEQGTMYAVYDFLELGCGVRWFNPTDGGMYCPKTPTLTVKVATLRRAPAFRYRDIWPIMYLPDKYDTQMVLWQEKTPQFQEYETLAYSGLHKQFPDASKYLSAKKGRVTLFLHRMRVGGENCPCNHSLYGFYDRFWQENPASPDVFVESHPDWFAQGYEGRPPQMCYTSKGLIKQVAQDARDFFDGKGLKPGAVGSGDYFAVVPMDDIKFCQCDNCRKFTANSEDLSDYCFNFVNEVAKEVGKTHPGKYISALAYSRYTKVPKNVRLEPNVAVQYCFWDHRMFNIGDACKNEWVELKDWVKTYGNHPLYLWLYYDMPWEFTNLGEYHCFPAFFAHTIFDQFREFQRLGLRGMFHCGYGQDVEAYVTYKAMIDPKQDCDAILNDYFTGLYGAAAKPMRELYDGIEKTYSDPKNYPPNTARYSMQLFWGNLGTEERMAQFAGLMEKAKGMAQTEMEQRNVKLFDLSIWSFMVAGRKQFADSLNSPVPVVKAPLIASADGDAAKADWSKAAPLPGTWTEMNQAKPSTRKLEGRVAHDGKYLYFELTDYCATKMLQISPILFPYDDWEIFIAKEKGAAYRQFAVGPRGQLVALRYGEDPGKASTEIESHGILAVSDTSAPDRWTVRLAIPLSTLVKGGFKPGETIFANINRVASPSICGVEPYIIDNWVPFTSVHNNDRMGEIHLEK